jgi:lysophospholipase L1-like esterase
MQKLRLLLLSGGLLTILLTAGLLVHPLTEATTPVTPEVAWAKPSVMALKRVNSVSPHQSEPDYFSNLDCTLVTYHLVSNNTMQSGCFTDTAYGQIDADSDVVIFNGTDEGLQLVPFTAKQLLVPWPKALDLVALDISNTGGAYLNLYKNPLATLHNQRNILGQLTAKQLTAPPELPLLNAAGQRLVINGQSIAYADSGSWVVVEVLGGSFERINLATLQMVPFAPSYARQGSPALDSSSITISADGRYIAVENTYATEFKVYDLSQCSAGVCASYDYWPFIGQQVSGLRFISHVRFINDGLLSFDASSGTANFGGTYMLAPTAGITSLIDYLALGDSYSSGEGAFNYLDGTDTSNNNCHLSSHSYPLLLTHDLFTNAGGHSVACSGAVIHDIGDKSDSYRGQVRGVANWQQLQQTQAALLASIMANYLPGYVAQQRFVSQYQPATITIGVGGNNFGFGDILQRCLEPKTNLRLTADTCFATYEDRQELRSMILRTSPQLRKLYEQLAAESPLSSIYVIGYPQIAIDTGVCALNVYFSDHELEFVNELVDEINNTIALAATAAGAHYVDISQALVGHRLCEATGNNLAVNGLTAGTDGGPGNIKIFGGESYHPNALGQQLIEQAILTQTHNLRLSKTALSPAPKKPSDNFVSGPKSGRPINLRLPKPTLTTAQASPGQVIPIGLDGLDEGLVPGDSYTVHLDGAQGAVVGTLVGGGSHLITLPVIIEPGAHSIDVIGQNQAGQIVDIVKTIEIIPAPPVLITTPTPAPLPILAPPVVSIPSSTNGSSPAPTHTGSPQTPPAVLPIQTTAPGATLQPTIPVQIAGDTASQPDSALIISRTSDDTPPEIIGATTHIRSPGSLPPIGVGSAARLQATHNSDLSAPSNLPIRLPFAKLQVIPWVLWSAVALTCLLAGKLVTAWLRRCQDRSA